MKKLILTYLLTLTFSCSETTKPLESWYFSYNNDSNAPVKVTIQEDSIIFHYSYINLLEKEALKIDKSHFYFKEFKVPYKLKNDSLIVAGSQIFVKNPVIKPPEISGFDQMVKINLPQHEQDTFQIRNPWQDNAFFKYFGVNPKTNKYELLINDQFISNFEDYLSSFSTDSHGGWQTDYLLIDKNSKMIELEKLFIASKYMNQLRVVFVNEIQALYKDSVGIENKHFTLKKNFSPNLIDEVYIDNLMNTYKLTLSPPPPLPYPDLPNFRDSNYPKAFLIELRNNSLYYQNEKISFDQLTSLLHDVIQNQNPIITLYDFESNYDTFLKLNLTISNAFYYKRQAFALNKFNKNFHDLDKESIYEIKELLPMRHVWDYSMMHFNEVIKKDGTFFGLNID